MIKLSSIIGMLFIAGSVMANDNVVLTDDTLLRIDNSAALNELSPSEIDATKDILTRMANDPAIRQAFEENRLDLDEAMAQYGLGDIFGSILGVVKSLLPKVLEIGGKIFQGIKALGPKLLAAAKGVVETAKSFAQKIVGSLSGLWAKHGDTIKAGVKDAATVAKQTVDKIQPEHIDKAIDVAGQFADVSSQLVGALVPQVPTAVSSNLANAANNPPTTPEQALNMVSAVNDLTTTVATSTTEGASDAASEANDGDAVKNALRTIGNLNDYLKNNPKLAPDVRNQILQTIINMSSLISAMPVPTA